MGLDFIRKAAPTFHKALDRRAVELRTPTLFNRDIPSVARSRFRRNMPGVQPLRPAKKSISAF